MAPATAIALERRIAVQLPSLLGHHSLLPRSRHFRSLCAATTYSRLKFRSVERQCPAQEQRRAFSSSRKLRATVQEAPSAKSYIESGVIAGARNLVNVKKVLVIGSGGLSIGQAGEFDYSGALLACGLDF